MNHSSTIDKSDSIFLVTDSDISLSTFTIAGMEAGASEAQLHIAVVIIESIQMGIQIVSRCLL
jgi:hypothetical protein